MGFNDMMGSLDNSGPLADATLGKPEDKGNEANTGFLSLGASVPLKFAYDFAKFGTDVYDFVAGNEKATLDDYWKYEEENFGLVRTENQQMVGELLTFLVPLGGQAKAGLTATKGLSKSLTFLKAADKIDDVKDLSKMGKFVSMLFEGMYQDAIHGSTEHPRLAQFIKKYFPDAEVPLLDYLAADDDDSELHKRFKNALEGSVVGGTLGAGLSLLGGFAKFAKLKGDGTGAMLNNAAKHSEIERSLGVSAGSLMGKTNIADNIDISSLSKSVIDVTDEAFTVNSIRSMGYSGDEAIVRRMIDGDLNAVEEVVANISSRVVKEGSDAVLNEAKFLSKDVPVVSRNLFDALVLQGTKTEGKGLLKNIETAGYQAFKQLSGSDNLAKAFVEGSDNMSQTYLKTLPERVQIFRMLFSKESKVLTNIADQLLKNPDDALLQTQFINQMIKAGKTEAVLGQMSQSISHSLSSFKNVIPKEAAEAIEKLSKDDMLLREVSEVIGNVKDTGKFKELAETIITSKGSFDKMSKGVANKTREVGYLDFLREHAMTSMLGPATHVVNFAGNTMKGIAQNLEYIIAGMTGSIRKAFGSKTVELEMVDSANHILGTMGFHKNISLKQMGHQLGVETKENFVDAITSANILENFRKSGLNPDSPLLKSVAWAGDLYGKVARGMSFGALQHVDELTSGSSSMGMLKMESSRVARSMGKGAELAKEIELGVLKKINNPETMFGADEVFETITTAIADKVRLAGKKGTFQEELTGGLKTLQGKLGSDSKTWKMISTFIVPFFKTPVNLVSDVAQHTPILHKFSKRAREALSGSLGESTRQLAQAKLALGGMVYAGIGYAVLSGKVTGKHKRSDRELLTQQGIPEYSIQVGDTWVQYNRLDPVGMMIGLVADSYTLSEAGDGQTAIGTTILALGNNLVSKTYMKGVQDVMQLFTEENMDKNKFLINKLRPILNPMQGLQKVVNQVRDPKRRELPKDLVDIEDWFSVLFQDNVFYNDELPTAVDMFGNEMDNREMTATERGLTAFGMRTSQTTDSEGSREMARLRAARPQTAPTVYGVEMTQKEAREYRKMLKTDFDLEGILNDVVKDPSYRELPDEIKEKILKGIIRDAREGSKALLYLKSPNLQGDIFKKTQEDIQAFLMNPTDLSEPNDVNDIILNRDAQAFEANPLRR